MKKTDCLDKVCDQSQSHDSICRKHLCVRNLYFDKFDHRFNRKIENGKAIWLILKPISGTFDRISNEDHTAKS